MLRRARNVISVLCALVPLLLIPMWVRSYHRADEFCAGLMGHRSILVSSKEGRATTIFVRSTLEMDQKHWTVTTRMLAGRASFPSGVPRTYEAALGFGWITHPDYVLDIVGPPGTAISLVPAGTPNGLTTLLFTDAQGNVMPGTASWASQTFDGHGTVTSWATSSNLTSQARVVPKLDAAGPIVPYWFLLLLSGAAFALTRLQWPWRFGVRTLLAAMTYVAVVLALVAILDR
jgi:hypothetical protein